MKRQLYRVLGAKGLSKKRDLDIRHHGNRQNLHESRVSFWTWCWYFGEDIWRRHQIVFLPNKTYKLRESEQNRLLTSALSL